MKDSPCISRRAESQSTVPQLHNQKWFFSLPQVLAENNCLIFPFSSHISPFSKSRRSHCFSPPEIESPITPTQPSPTPSHTSSREKPHPFPHQKVVPTSPPAPPSHKWRGENEETQAQTWPCSCLWCYPIGEREARIERQQWRDGVCFSCCLGGC